VKSKYLFVAAAATIAVAGLAAMAYFGASPSLRGSKIDPPLPAADLILTDTSGQAFSLSDQRGKVTLIFFGYTNCPDECPLTMASLKLAMDMLGADASRTAVVLVTTDPKRDTSRALDVFLGRFREDFIGLTGSEEQLAQVWRDYGVTVMDGGETHSNYIYVIDPSGNLVETVLADSGPADIAADIRVLLGRN